MVGAVHESVDPERLRLVEPPLVVVQPSHVRDHHLAPMNRERPLSVRRRELRVSLNVAVRGREDVQARGFLQGRVQEGEGCARDDTRVRFEQRVFVPVENLLDGAVERILEAVVRHAVAKEVREEPVRDAHGVGIHAPQERLDAAALVARRHLGARERAENRVPERGDAGDVFGAARRAPGRAELDEARAKAALRGLCGEGEAGEERGEEQVGVVVDRHHVLVDVEREARPEERGGERHELAPGDEVKEREGIAARAHVREARGEGTVEGWREGVERIVRVGVADDGKHLGQKIVEVLGLDVADAAALERPNRRELVSAVAEEGVDGLGRGEEDEGLSADEGAEVDSMFLPTRKTL